jgi:hypothetical protein
VYEDVSEDVVSENVVRVVDDVAVELSLEVLRLVELSLVELLLLVLRELVSDSLVMYEQMPHDISHMCLKAHSGQYVVTQASGDTAIISGHVV